MEPKGRAMHRISRVFLLVVFTVIGVAGLASADDAALRAALERVEALADGPAIHLPANVPAYMNLMTANGYFDELGLTRDEALTYVEALLRRRGVDPTALASPLPKAPPTNPVHTIGEFEPMAGVVFRYPLDASFMEITYRQMLTALDGDPNVTVYLLVNNSSQEATVRNHLEGFGITGDNFEYYYIRTYSVWARDYGPIFLAETDGDQTVQSIVDMDYFYPFDNNVPAALGDEWGLSVYPWDIDFEGGNYMTDGEGTCFSSTGIQTFNPGRTLDEIREELADYFGCEKHIMVQPMIGEGTTHIDMSAKLLDPHTVLVGQYQLGERNYDRLEAVATQIAGETNLAGEPFEVIRVPMPPEYTINEPGYGDLDIFRSYTNSLILNDKVLVPIYNIDMDADGLAAYEDFYAGKDMQVIGIDSELLIEWLGAVHCVAMERPVEGYEEPIDDDDDTTDDDATDDDATDDDAADDDAADDDATDDDTTDDDATDDDATDDDATDDDTAATDDDATDGDDDNDDDSGCGC